MHTERRGRILVIDDTPRNIEILCAILQPENYEVLSAPTGEIGIQMVEEQDPDLVLLDLVLPGIMGIEVLEQLRETHPLTTVILTTAYGSEETAIQALRHGVHDYIINKRPFDPIEVRDVVRRGISESRLKHENQRLSQELERVNCQLQEYANHLEKTVTELRSANERLTELDRIKASFISMISHELRHPLTVAKGYLELVEADDRDDLKPESRRYLKIVNDNFDQLAGMIEDLLDMSQMEAGRFKIQRQLVRAESVVNHVCQAFSAAAHEKGLKIASHVGDEIPLLNADPVRIVQVLSNLVQNAIKFTPTEGAISISVVSDGPSIRFCVQDTGVGIPASELDKVFDRFYQVQRPDTGTMGAGLGLAICREIIRLHGGQIWAESQVGTGTSIIFTLPLVGEEAVNAA